MVTLPSIEAKRVAGEISTKIGMVVPRLSMNSPVAVRTQVEGPSRAERRTRKYLQQTKRSQLRQEARISLHSLGRSNRLEEGQ